MNKIVEIREENNRMSEKLSDKNDKLYTDFVCYLRVSKLSDEEQEEIINDVLEMFLKWQEQGEDVEKMVGGDLKKFADETIEAVNPTRSLGKTIRENLLLIVKCFCIMLTIDFVFLYIPQIIRGNMSMVYKYDLSMLVKTLLIIVAAELVVNYIGKNAFELTRASSFKRDALAALGGVIIIALLVLISEVLSSVVLFSISVFVVMAIIAVYWICELIIKKYI